MTMRREMKGLTAFMIGAALVCCVAVPPASRAAGFTYVGQRRNTRRGASAINMQAVIVFERRVKEYAELREGLEEKLPKLPKESTPEQIEAHKTTFREMVRAARAGAKPGDLFTPEIAAHIRATIRDRFRGRKLRELREEVLEAETAGVPLRVN